MPSLDVAAASGVGVSANAILFKDNKFLWAGWTHPQISTSSPLKKLCAGFMVRKSSCFLPLLPFTRYFWVGQVLGVILA
ncbi:hypothetical protein LC608_15915 [Nostoc sp. XA010]|uniref:hypothetical protein n=1 Tax=Nostoc sp. XA010 TaxID=2780407 RepID=UPI001E601F82|nr:hypothetical protein [Nostoc sp. XA010]MCC5658448.1 hypothetical protein [Nostoc sp. XA010]